MSSIVREVIDNVNHSERTVEDGVLDLIHSIMHLYRSQQYHVLRDGPHAITHMESKVLRYFEQHPRATQSDCARDSGRDKAQLARLVATLRSQGLLEGEIDNSDRRNVRLSLTPAGASVQSVLAQQARRLNGQAVHGLSAAECQHLMTMLSRVKQNLVS